MSSRSTCIAIGDEDLGDTTYTAFVAELRTLRHVPSTLSQPRSCRDWAAAL